MNIPRNYKPDNIKYRTEEKTGMLFSFLVFLLVAMADFLVENISHELQIIFSHLLP